MNKGLLLACAMSVVSTSALAQGPVVQPPAASGKAPLVSVTLGDVTDNRTNGQFFSGMRVDFKLSGEAVYDAYGIGKPVFTAAVDDSGRSIVKEEKDSTLMWDLKTRQQKSNNETVTADLANPSRKAGVVTLQGFIPVYSPALDPSAVVTISDITTLFGKPMASKNPEISITVLDKTSYEAFNKARAEEQKAKAAANLGAALGQMFSMGSIQSNDLQFRISDPNKMLVRLEVIDHDGKAIETNGRSKSSSNGEDVYTNNYNQPLPKGAGLKIYYATPKAMINVPFDFQNVVLP